MVYNVAGLLKGRTGETRTVELDERLVTGEPDVTLLALLTGTLRLTRDLAGVLVQGEVRTRMAVPCGRCLAPATQDVVIELEEQFTPTVSLAGGPPIVASGDDDVATHIDAHHQVDLTEVLRQAVLLAVPVQPLCRPECRGLCPYCGQDLNVGPCDCQPELDPRWQSLRDLVIDDET